MAITISTNFESASIRCLSIKEPGEIQLELRDDPIGGERYWYYFRLLGVRGKECRLTINNAADAFRLAEREELDIPGPYVDYSACASYDRVNWFRIPTEFKDGLLTFTIKSERDSVYFASFAPYSHERHMNLIDHALTSKAASLEVLGKTHRDNDIELLKIGSGDPETRSCWICARQHPSETMAEWFTEGLLEGLLDNNNAISRSLLSKATFYVVPCMNPDGAWSGRTRRNGGDVDLNREWVTPSMEKSPEVFLVQQRMQETNVDFFMDVHGDEELPYVFLGGPLEVPSVTKKMESNFRHFQDVLQTVNPDYRRGYEYPGGPPPNPDLRMAWNYIGETYRCLSILVEQPFKDCTHAKDITQGWSPERSKELGNASLTAIHAVLDSL
tara:strand:+ start:42 stop:1199 length:1158 start_codon:yes stop_codon:yes gene_type:complete